MNELEKAARQALEALEHEAEVGNDDAYKAERTALLRALEQPDQFAQPRNMVEQPEHQEPVAWANSNDLQNFDMKVRTNGGPLHTVPLYTRPQAREWVGLTDEDIWDVYTKTDSMQYMAFSRAIEAKLKEKNT